MQEIISREHDLQQQIFWMSDSNSLHGNYFLKITNNEEIKAAQKYWMTCPRPHIYWMLESELKPNCTTACIIPSKEMYLQFKIFAFITRTTKRYILFHGLLIRPNSLGTLALSEQINTSTNYHLCCSKVLTAIYCFWKHLVKKFNKPSYNYCFQYLHLSGREKDAKILHVV